jgi:hypothetical protein
VFIGLKTDHSVPNIGRVSSAPVDTGYCDFSECDSFYFYHTWPPKAAQPIYWAEGNYFGPSGPDTSMIYISNGGIDYIPYINWNPMRAKFVSPERPLTFNLNAAYPNPFNPRTTISFSLDLPALTIVTIYNILGQKVVTPLDEYLESGEHSIIWDGRNSSGVQVSSGIYFHTIQSGDHFDSRKMLLLR